MKKTIFSSSVFAVLLFLSVSGLQAQNSKKVLVEVFTNSHCSVCPSMYNGLNTFVKPSPIADNIEYIFYHVNTYSDDVLYQETKDQSLPRAKYYAISGTPTAAFNGTVQNRSYANYPTQLQNSLTQTKDITLTIQANKDNNSLKLSLNASSVPPQSSLYIIMTEDIEYKGRNGIVNHTNVMRKMLTGTNGIVIDKMEGMIYEQTFSFSDMNIKNTDNARIVCFLQNNTTKEIYQTSALPLKDIVASISDSEQQSVTIYPQPAQDNLTITLDAKTINDNTPLTVYSLLGNKIMEIAPKFQRDGLRTFQWNLRDANDNKVSPGLYVIQSSSHKNTSFICIIQ